MRSDDCAGEDDLQESAEAACNSRIDSFAELASGHSNRLVQTLAQGEGDNAAQSEGRERCRNSHRRFSSIMTMPTRS